MLTLLLAAMLALSATEPAQQPTLRGLIESGNLSDLQWPDYSDYQGYVDAAYRKRNDALIWIREGKPTAQARELVRLFENADAKGLRPQDYDGGRWAGRIAKLADRNARERFDLAVTVTAMRYISDLHIGRVSPLEVSFDIDLGKKKYDLPTFLGEIASSQTITARLEEVEPQFEGYRRLRATLADYVKLSSEQDSVSLATGKSIAPGQPYESLPALAAWLRRLGDLPAGTVTNGNLYDGAVVEAVKQFQRRHGVAPDGVLGRGTFAKLQVPLSRRAVQIRLAMERWRWAPDSFDVSPIVVNIPEFRLRAYNLPDQRPVLSMNVVVGKAFATDTPIFEGKLRYLVFRPYWNVPPSIQTKELAPKMAADPSYAAKHSFEIVDSKGTVVTSVDSNTIEGVKKLRYSIRQKPGPQNALGNLKFMLPNDKNIYLHDTPSRDLFRLTRRDFSHGCIRLEDPPALAEWALRDVPGWSREKIAATIKGNATNVAVNVRKPIPVLIVYATVVVSDKGLVYFFDDIYGHDARLEDALARGYPYPW